MFSKFRERYASRLSHKNDVHAALCLSCAGRPVNLDWKLPQCGQTIDEAISAGMLFSSPVVCLFFSSTNSFNTMNSIVLVLLQAGDALDIRIALPLVHFNLSSEMNAFVTAFISDQRHWRQFEYYVAGHLTYKLAAPANDDVRSM